MTRHPSNTFTVAPGITVGCITADSITAVATDGIVNAANERLRGGSGVNGAIHADGGPDIMAECSRLGGCEPGQAKSTTAGMLPARRVIHAVGPRYYAVTREEAARLLASAYTVSLEVAARDGLARVTLPSLSTGSFGYPVEEATRVATRAVVVPTGGDRRNLRGGLRCPDGREPWRADPAPDRRGPGRTGSGVGIGEPFRHVGPPRTQRTLEACCNQGRWVRRCLLPSGHDRGLFRAGPARTKPCQCRPDRGEHAGSEPRAGHPGRGKPDQCRPDRGRPQRV
ncbi:MAG: hypothetical protein EBU62_16325 [Proteobacteria bacterium]|nr:hypothetical protein [Pseudomonadota bacterium]